MGIAEFILILVIAAKLFGAASLAAISWPAIAAAYVGFYIVILLLVALIAVVYEILQ